MEKSVKKDLSIGVIVVLLYLIAGTCLGEKMSMTMTYVLVFTLFGESFNLQFGYAGMTSLGHSMNFGLGGYILVALCQKTGMNVWIACILTIIICIVLYYVCGMVCLKNNMMTFTFLSMGLALSVSTMFSKWLFMGGTVGLNQKIAPDWMSGYRARFIFILAVVVICIVGIYLLAKSPFVTMLKGGRENEERLIFLGVNTNQLHTVVYTISTVLAAVAGMLFAFRNGGAYTASLDPSLSFEAIIMCIIGGRGNFFGPILGGFIVALVYNWLPGVTNYYQGFLGVFILLIVYFLREGLISEASPLVKLFRRRKAAGGQ